MSALLCACAEPQPHPSTSDTASVVPFENTGAQQPDSVRYGIVKQDQSILDDAGNVLVDWHYNQVVLKGDQSEIKTINQGIEQNCNIFLFAKKGSDFKANANDAVQQGVLDPEKTDSKWFNTADSEVTQNADGIFSIKITTGWYMGGVFNQDYSGLNYDLHTGKPVQLTDLLQQDEATLAQQLQDIVREYLQSDPGRFPSEEGLSAYKATTDFDFYIQNGEVILVFPTYEFGSGAAGATVIPTGLFMKTPQS